MCGTLQLGPSDNERMSIDADRLRRLREARAWSQEQLAEVAGLSVRTVQRVERGGKASLETRMALAAALEVAPADLLLADTADEPDIPATAAAPETSITDPQAEQRQRQEQTFRISLLVLLGVLILVLIVGLGYQFGRDLAHRENRAECEAAGRSDCR